MYKISAKYLGRRIYDIEVRTEGRTIRKQFVEPLFNASKAASRITEIVESLNVEEDIDVEEVVICSEIVEAAKRAGRQFYASCH